MLRTILTSCLLINCWLGIHAQSIESAFEKLKQNKRTEAIDEFSSLKNDATSGKDALLGLVLLELDNRHYEKAFDYFKEFASNNNNAPAYIYALWTSGIFNQLNTAKTQEAVAFLKTYVVKPEVDVTLKAMINELLGDQLFSSNKFKEALVEFGNIGDVRNWATVGVFENMSGSGFNKDFGVLAHPEAEYSFKNKVNVDVKWFNIKNIRSDRWLDLDYYYHIDNSVIYTQTFMESETDKEAIMMIGVSGSVKVWINDFLVFSEKEERNTDFDLYQAKVKLNAGKNRILVQTGCSDIDKNNFALRFKSLDGKIISNIKSSPVADKYTKAQPYEVVINKLWVEKFFEDRIVAGTTNKFLDLYMLLLTYNHNDKRLEARQIASKLKKEATLCTISNEQLCEAYARDENKTDLTKEYESIKKEDPSSFLGLTLQYSEAEETENYDECQKLLDKKIELYGRDENTDATQINIYNNRKEYEKMIEAVEASYKRYPDSKYFTMLKYNVDKAVKKKPKAANKILEAYNKRFFNESFRNTLLENYFEVGNTAKGYAMLIELSQIYPYSITYYKEISSKYNDQRDFNSAILWIDKAIERAPYVGSLYYTKGIYLESKGDKKAAEENFAKAIYYTPSYSEARKKLNEIRGKKDVFSHFKTEDVEKLVKESPSPDKYPDDNSIFLLSDNQMVIYPENGISEEKHHYLIKILNQGGIDNWKEVNLPSSYSQRLILDKAEIFKNDGSRVQAESNYGQLVFSSLEIGDVIHIYYKLETATSGKLAEHFWEDQAFNGYYPFLTSRFSMIVPESRKFQYKMYNTDIKPEVSDLEDNNKLYIWERTNVPSIKSEPYMPAFSDISEKVIVTSIPDWNYVANWYSDLSGIKTKGDYEVKEKVRELFADKKNLTDLQKAKLIYEYIENNYSYSSVEFLHSALTPQSASRTIRTKLGDCKDLSTLFVAMCKEIGLDANLILVDTRDNGDKNLDLPTIGFNHCIAQFKTGGKNYIVEMTNNYLPFGAMSSDLINTNGLYIPKDGEIASTAKLSKLNTTSRPQNLVLRTTNVVLKGKNAEISRNSVRTGVNASAIRYDYKNIGEEERKKNLSKSVSSSFSSNVKVNTVKFKNLDNLKDTLYFDYDFVVEGFASELVGMKVFTLPWVDAFESQNFVSLDERKFNFNLWDFNNTPYDKEVMTIVFPAGKRLAEIPKNVSLSCPGLTYNLKYEVKPGKLIATRELKYNTEIISKTDYPKFKKFIAKVNETDSKQYAIK